MTPLEQTLLEMLKQEQEVVSLLLNMLAINNTSPDQHISVTPQHSIGKARWPDIKTKLEKRFSKAELVLADLKNKESETHDSIDDLGSKDNESD
jgi:hypothetical protein